MFHELYEEKRNVTISEGHPDLAVQARITYDAMWLAALALDKVNRQLKTMSPPLSLSDFNYSNQNGTIIKMLFYQTALDTSFDGASVSNTFQCTVLFQYKKYHAGVHKFTQQKTLRKEDEKTQNMFTLFRIVNIPLWYFVIVHYRLDIVYEGTCYFVY